MGAEALGKAPRGEGGFLEPHLTCTLEETNAEGRQREEKAAGGRPSKWG